MRQALLVAHRWIALVVGLFIVVIALTGSAIVFEGAMDRGLHPGLWHVKPTGAPLSLDTLIARARARLPKAPILGISLSPTDDRADVVQAGPTQIFVDPYTATVLGTRTIAEWNKTLPRRLHVLHVSLMAGRIGGGIVGITTVAALVLVLSGLILWWRDKLWRIRWSGSWKLVVFDVHHTVGAFAALIAAIIVASGLVIHYDSLRSMMLALDSTPPADLPAQPAPPPGGEAHAISADSLYRVAVNALPGARVMFLAMQPNPDEPFLAQARFPEDRTPGGRSRVVVNRFTGVPLLVVSTRQAQLGTRMANVIRSVHTGDQGGKSMEAIWLLAALGLASQGVTGFLMWWNGRAGRSARSRGRGVAAPAALATPGVGAQVDAPHRDAPQPETT